MKRFVLMTLAAVAMVACGPKEVSHVLADFGPVGAPEQIRFVVGYDVDTLINVVDGKLDATIPADIYTVSYAFSDGQPMQFVSDGSTLTLDFVEKTILSSDKNGVQARLSEYRAWEKSYMEEFRTKAAGLSEEELDAFLDESVDGYNVKLKEWAKANPDNVVGLLAISALSVDDAELLETLKGMSRKVQELEEVDALIKRLEAVLATAEGKMFQDFTVVQDPDDPENSTVKFSDVIGKGKYVLVNFWGTWNEACRNEIPYLREVYDKYKGDDFDVLGVAVNDNPDYSKIAVMEDDMHWPQIFNSELAASNAYGLQDVPYTILFGPDGTILKRDLRGEAIGEAVAQALGR